MKVFSVSASLSCKTMIPEQSEMRKESVTQHRNVVKKSTDTCVSMNSRSLISIRGKSWPWVVRHFTTLVVNACQMLRFVPVDQGTGVLERRFNYID